jgi:hypothetical protein
MIRRSTLVILVIFAGLAALAFFLQRSNDSKEAQSTSTETAPFLFKFNSEISGFRLEQVGVGTVELTKDPNTGWMLIWPKAEGTNTGAVESAISQLLSLRIASTLEDGPSLEEAGLVNPSYRLLIKLEDGEQVVMSVGDETPTGSGYYVQVSNRGLFVVNKYSLDPFLKLVQDPPIKLTETPTMESSATASENEPASTPIP